uniref:Putative secreted protein n=1 Tax=Ixodes ricinus TaxID=34613 RepID=A0A6B0TXM8_IXORI
MALAGCTRAGVVCFLRVCLIQILFAGPIGSQSSVLTAQRNASSYTPFHLNLTKDEVGRPSEPIGMSERGM